MKSSNSSITLPRILSNTPALLEKVIEGLGDEILYWQPKSERWSASMVIAHLAESEVNCFRARLQKTANEESPLLAPYDQWAYLRAGDVVGVQDALTILQHERKITLAFLRALPANVLGRKCQHQKLGVLTFENLLNEFAFHDMGHLRQILELCRAVAFYPKMGGWQQYYQVNP